MHPIDFYLRLLERSGTNTTELARQLKTSGRANTNLQPSLAKWIKSRGATQIVPMRSTLKPVADFFKVSVEAFYDPAVAQTEAERLGIAEARLTVHEGGRHDRRSARGEIEIPEYSTGGSMGFGVILKDQPGQIRSWRVTHEWVRKNVRSHTSTANLCVVTGFGDSMRPLFNPGDPLLIDAGVKTVDFDGIYFFRVANEGFIKRLQRVPGEGLFAISENKSYRDWVIKPDADFEVFGRVLRIWRGDDY